MKSVLVVAILIAGASIAFGQVYYDPDILALIDVHGCGSCHGGTSGFFVTPYDSIMASGNHRPVVVPLDTNSIIIQKLKGTASFGSRMPFGGPFLSAVEIDTFVRWIKGGAVKSATVGVPEASPGIPLRPSLSQNYPNPFNPSTVISCRLSVAGYVKLAVFDLAGRELAVLVDGVRQPGTYNLEFSGAGLPSGMYFYRLDAPGMHETRKMVILR
jgi:hypothetical protein